MKIKIFKFITIFFILCISSQIKADTIYFDSKNMKIEDDGNLIYSGKGITKIPSQQILIEGDKSIYNKLISELIIIGNVQFYDDMNGMIIQSEEAIYNEINNTILAKGKTLIRIENEYVIISENVLYDRNSMKIVSELNTKVYDNLNNIYNFSDGFIFDKINETISSKTTNIIDSDNNSYVFDHAKINLKTKELVGKEVRVDFINDFFGDEENDPLLKGKSATSDNENTIIQKAVFSTCNIENKKCRGWEIQSEEFKHNKIEKLFEYKKSWLKVFDKKVFYLPYFNHPDPSVKRKSGFLTPTYSSSDNLGRSLNIPYFYVLSETKDMTFNPRIYTENDNFILQSEYRQAFENSNLIADFSFNSSEKNSSTHAIIELEGDIDKDTSYLLEFENVSGNDNYLKIHDFKNIQDTNRLMKKINTSSLASFLKIDKDIDEDTSLTSTIRMYEDLTVTNNNDKYQYVFPDFSFYKKIDLEENYDGTLVYTTSGYQKLYSTNIFEAQLNNDFNFESFDYINKGIVSNYNFLLKNYNTYGENSSVFDENNDHKLFGTLVLNSELPLKKEFSNSTNFLKPKIQMKFSPTNGKDISSSGGRLTYDGLFSVNRIGRSDMVEEGRSLSIGIEYEKIDLSNDKLIGFNIGNIIKDKKNSSMPSKSKLDQTRSDIAGNFFYEPNDKIKFEYNFSYDRDLDFSNYDAISAKFGNNKLITEFDYITENHELGDSETIKNNTQFNFNDEHSLLFMTSKNLKTDFTEVINLNYEYNTDCLSASLHYQKKFFRDDNLVPDKSIYFLIKFIPFAEIRGSANTIFKEDKKNEN